VRCTPVSSRSVRRQRDLPPLEPTFADLTEGTSLPESFQTVCIESFVDLEEFLEAGEPPSCTKAAPALHHALEPAIAKRADSIAGQIVADGAAVAARCLVDKVR
jgi:hypothetical protein